MIEIKGLTKNFGEKRAVDDLTLTVREGVAYGFLGRNGAGKTTTIRILMNVFREDGGVALIDGVPAYKEPKRIGYLPEERGMYSKRGVLEQLVYFGKLKGMDRETAAREAHAKLAEMDATEYTNNKLETLSKGNQQKIQLAAALLGDPDIIILDEPFSGLDPINAQVLKDAVRRQVDEGRTVIFSSHQMAQVEEFCDEICIIDRGHSVLEGNLAQIKRSYPRNKIRVEVEDTAAASVIAGAASVIAGAASVIAGIDPQSIVSVVPEGAGYTVTLDDPAHRNLLLHRLADAGIQVSAFFVIEPTLEQIFVERVGEKSEEKAIA
ncbi:MAG: ATP-binding cassette domain-containing protein [Clostridiales Family XIII bacterium]|jgi:ABC-2 type transport system ATP-binding protein|nr:ATP-binding cassette domain-containing protein [Clostridiales Family XIII bacterium]